MDNNLFAQNSSLFVSLGDVLNDAMNNLEEMGNSETYLSGLSTGFSALDSKIMGLSKSDLIILASRPGMGKTSLALNIALNAAKKSRKAVAFFSPAMSREQLVMRLCSIETHIENVRLRSGELSESDWEQVAEGISILQNLDILIDDNPRVTVSSMNEKCRHLDNLGLVVIDYLQLITSADEKSNTSESRYQVVSDISRALKIMARELDVPVLCLSQLSRANEKREDKRPILSDLRESGTLEDDADVVVFLYRDDYYYQDSEKFGIAECIVAKNRNGKTGTVNLYWRPECTLFLTLADYETDETE